MKTSKKHQVESVLLIVAFAVGLLFPVQFLGGSELEKKEKSKHKIIKADKKSAKKGEKFDLLLNIKTFDDGYIHPKAPFEIKVETSKNILTPKSTISRKDTTGFEKEKAINVGVKIPVTAKDIGKGEIKASLEFFLCTEVSCKRTIEEVSWDVGIAN